MKNNVVSVLVVLSFVFFTAQTSGYDVSDINPDTSLLSAIRYNQMLDGFSNMKRPILMDTDVSVDGAILPARVVVPSTKRAGCFGFGDGDKESVNIRCLPPPSDPPSAMVSRCNNNCQIESRRIHCVSVGRPGTPACEVVDIFYIKKPSGH